MGLQALAAHLKPGGVFVLWSDDPPDERFVETLGTVFESSRAQVVTFWNPLLDSESASTVYVASNPT